MSRQTALSWAKRHDFACVLWLPCKTRAIHCECYTAENELPCRTHAWLGCPIGHIPHDFACISWLPARTHVMWMQSPLCEWLGIEAYTIHICGLTMRILTHYIACATTVRILWHVRCECIFNDQTDIEAYIIHLCESNHLVNDTRQRMCNNHIDIEAHFNAIVYATAKNEF